MEIQAAVLEGARQAFRIETVDLQDPHQGEILVKIAASGVCHSDYHLVTGDTRHPMPLVAGHEGAGVVEAVGAEVSGIQVGDHVCLNWAPDCGSCFYCLSGKPNLCETFTAPIWAGTMLDGTTRLYRNGQPLYHYCGLATFAEYVVLPQQSCVPIRKDVPLAIAALVGCAVATGVGSVFYTAGVRPSESVVVFGCGGVGLNILQAASLSGATTIIAVDTNAAKLTLAQQFGATHALLTGDHLLDKIRELTNGRGADHAFEAVGVPAVQETAFDAIRPGGVLTLVGLSPMGTGTNLPGAIIARQEKVIKGSYYGSINARRDFPLMLDMYMGGKLRLDQLISQQYKLDEINTAFERMLTGEVARGVIVF